LFELCLGKIFVRCSYVVSSMHRWNISGFLRPIIMCYLSCWQILGCLGRECVHQLREWQLPSELTGDFVHQLCEGLLRGVVGLHSLIAMYLLCHGHLLSCERECMRFMHQGYLLLDKRSNKLCRLRRGHHRSRDQVFLVLDLRGGHIFVSFSQQLFHLRRWEILKRKCKCMLKLLSGLLSGFLGIIELRQLRLW
jgi:hypothetical protein